MSEPNSPKDAPEQQTNTQENNDLKMIGNQDKQEQKHEQKATPNQINDVSIKNQESKQQQKQIEGQQEKAHEVQHQQVKNEEIVTTADHKQTQNQEVKQVQVEHPQNENSNQQKANDSVKQQVSQQNAEEKSPEKIDRRPSNSSEISKPEINIIEVKDPDDDSKADAEEKLNKLNSLQSDGNQAKDVNKFEKKSTFEDHHASTETKVQKRFSQEKPRTNIEQQKIIEHQPVHIEPVSKQPQPVQTHQHEHSQQIQPVTTPTKPQEAQQQQQFGDFEKESPSQQPQPQQSSQLKQQEQSPQVNHIKLNQQLQTFVDSLPDYSSLVAHS